MRPVLRRNEVSQQADVKGQSRGFERVSSRVRYPSDRYRIAALRQYAAGPKATSHRFV